MRSFSFIFLRIFYRTTTFFYYFYHKLGGKKLSENIYCLKFFIEPVLIPRIISNLKTKVVFNIRVILCVLI